MSFLQLIRRLVHNWFIDVGNLFEIVGHYFLIERMTYLGHRDRCLIGAKICAPMTYIR